MIPFRRIAVLSNELSPEAMALLQSEALKRRLHRLMHERDELRRPKRAHGSLALRTAILKQRARRRRTLDREIAEIGEALLDLSRYTSGAL